MNYHLRLESTNDFRETENIIRESFWDVYTPGCNEHLIAHNMRTADVFVKELDYVVCHGSKVIGNIMYTKALVIDERGIKHEVLCLGPICVLPEYQNKGVGTLLITESINKARESGYKGIFLMGNPTYYSRFGFVDAKAFKITTSDGENHEYFMGLELSLNSLHGITGKFKVDSVFETSENELEEFEKQFPKKEKHVTATQLK